MSDAPIIAVLKGPPIVLDDGALLVPMDDVSHDSNLPSEGDLVVLSWPEGLARGVCRELRFVVVPEIQT